MPKRIKLLILCSAATALGATVYGQVQKGNYSKATLGQVAQSVTGAHTHSPDSDYGVAPYPLYPPELEAGDGKAETEGYCAVCHSTRYITMQPPLPAATWEAEVTKMKKIFGATIPDEAASKILRYLQEHYTPETRKK